MSTSLPPEIPSSQSPVLPPAAVNDSAETSTSQVSTGPATNTSESLARQMTQFVQQVSTLQGQLPASVQDVQQQLLRQLADMLTRSPVPALDTVLPPNAQQNLQQWLGHITTVNPATPLPAPVLASWLSTLSSQSPDTSLLGRTLLQWATQLVLSRWPQPLPPTLQSAAPNPAPLPLSLQWPLQAPTGRELVALDSALASTLRFLQTSLIQSRILPPSAGMAGNATASTNSDNDRATDTSTTSGSAVTKMKLSGRQGDAGTVSTYLRPQRIALAEVASNTQPGRTDAGNTKPESGKAEGTATQPAQPATTVVNVDKPTMMAGLAQSSSLQSAGTALRDAAASTNSTTTDTTAKIEIGKTPLSASADTASPPPTAIASAQVVSSASIDSGMVQGHTATAPSQLSATSQPWIPPASMPGAMPLGDYLHQLGTLLAKRNLPDILRPALQQIDKIFTTPLTQGPQVEEWFSFLRQPLFGDSGQSKALLQWGIALLTYRLQQLGNQSTSPTQVGNAPLPMLPREEEAPSHWARSATGQLLQQAERLSPSPADTPPWLIPHLPLPPHYSGGRGGQLSLRRQQGTDNKTQWVLNFSLEPEQLGPIRIKAFLDLPTIRLQTVAERAQTVDRLRENLPVLEARLRDLGLQPEPSQCRQEKVTMVEETAPIPNDGFSVRI